MALVSLLNGKNKTMFSRLTRWLDRLFPFDFSVEYKPGAKIGLADYLSGSPSSLAKPVSQYDSMFTVAKINSINRTFGLKSSLSSGGPKINQQYASPKQVSPNRNTANYVPFQPREDEVTCVNGSANRNQPRQGSRRLGGRNLKIVGAITNLKDRGELLINNSNLSNIQTTWKKHFEKQNEFWNDTRVLTQARAKMK